MVRERISASLRDGSNDSVDQQSKQSTPERTRHVHGSSLVHQSDPSDNYWILTLGNHLLRIRKWFYGAVEVGPRFLDLTLLEQGSAPNLLLEDEQ